MSNCSKYSELISAYADGEVTSEEKALAEKHIAECESCKQKLDFILKTKEVFNNTPPMPVPETLLADFTEFKKKSEEQEKKVVPFYKNYRVYTSIAAVFVFAFVLKSGLWQDDKYLPEQINQGTYSQQTLTVAEQKSSDEADKTEPAATSDIPSSGSNAKQQADVKIQNQPVQNVSKPVEVKTETTSSDVVIPSDNAALPEPESVQEQNTPAPAAQTAVSDQSAEYVAINAEDNENGSDNGAASGGGGGSSAYSRMAGISEPVQDNSVQQEQTTLNAQIYVSEQDLEKAKQLLSDNSYFFHQVEQKMNDNLIPFESNFLLLDESKPHKIEVLVKSE